MFTTETYIAFILASIVLAAVPGPTVTVILANSLRHGMRAGLANIAGTQLGFILWLIIAVLGLAATTGVPGIWYDVLRLAGATYIVWLGIKMLRGGRDIASVLDNTQAHGRFFFQGFVVILSNPKMPVLFGALIPSMLNSSGNIMLQTLSLGLSFMLVAILVDMAYAVLGARAGKWLQQSHLRALELASGLLLVAAGLWMAFRLH